MDPLTIIGTAGAIANIVDVLTKIITTVCDTRQAWKTADLTVLAFESQLSLLKDALAQIQQWVESNTSEQHHQLVMRLEGCVTCCRFLVGKIDAEVSKFERTAAGDLEPATKIGLLLKTKDMEQVQRMIEQQTQALTLLLTACNANAMEEQKRVLQQPKAIRTFRKMDQDTASLIVHRDADSIITATSESSSKWSVQFSFDNELFVTKVYERWIRKLATSRRTHSQGQSIGTENQQQESPKSGQTQRAGSAGGEQKSDRLTRTSSVISGQSSRSSLSLGERVTLIGRSAMSFELQPLKQSRESRELRQQTEKSQAIDRDLKDEFRRRRTETKALLLGSDCRKEVLEEWRRGHEVQSYTEEQLRIFRPAIFKTLVECAQRLAAQMRHYEVTEDLDPIWHHVDYILTYEFESKPGANLDPDFAIAIGTILESPAAKALTADIEKCRLAENAESFFSQVSRLSSTTYVPHETDVTACKLPPPGPIEIRRSEGNLSMRLVDPGVRKVESHRWMPLFEEVDEVIYVIDLDAYDRVHPDAKNELSESLAHFEWVVNSKWFRGSAILLILAKADKMKQKLPTTPLDQYFSDYSGGNDINEAVKYILWRFNQVNRNQLQIYQHIRGISNTSSFNFILTSTREMIINRALRGLPEFKFK